MSKHLEPVTTLVHADSVGDPLVEAWSRDKEFALEVIRRRHRPSRIKRPAAGYIYFAEASDTGLVKIGFSANPESRVKTIGAMSAAPVRLIATKPGVMADEQELHKRFDHYRAHGEWFHFGFEISEYIRGIK